MALSQDLKQLLDEQRVHSKNLEAVLAELEETDFLRETEELRQETAHLRDSLAARTDELTALRQENVSLRERLAEQLYSQREGLLQSSRKQADALFSSEEEGAVNRLAAHNTQVRQRLGELRTRLAAQGPAAEGLLAEVGRLEEASRQFMRSASAELDAGFRSARAEAEAGFDALGREPLREAQVGDKLRQNSLELRIGGRITVVVGVFFMLLAVVLGLRYTYLYLLQSNLLKGLLAYLIGLLFLGGGELAGRKQRSYFSKGLCAGGVAILFASTAVSYFNLEILSMWAAVGVCVSVTALALLLSMRHDAQVIAVFALIGGYLPMSALTRTPVMTVSAMGYFLLLNLFVLLVALRKLWQPLKFFSFGLNVLGVGYLLFGEAGKPMGMTAGSLYLLANLLLYMAIVLVYPILRRTVLRKSDTVLLGLNTAFTCGLFFALLYVHDLQQLAGAVALGFCLVYFAFAWWLGRVLEQDAGSRGLFYATSFAFWALAVPLQFEPGLISLGWLCEGVALWVFGVFSGRKWYRRAGGVLSLLCFGAFLIRDLPFHAYYSYDGDSLFVWKYGAVTLGAVILFATALYRHRGDAAYWRSGEGRAVTVLQGCALVNVWLYGLYLLNRALYLGMKDLLWEDFWRGMVFTTLTLGLGILYRAVTPLRGKAVAVISRCLYGIGFLFALYLSWQVIPTPEAGRWVLALVLLIAVEVAAVGALFELLRSFSRRGRLAPAWPSFAASLYALVLVLGVMLVQGRLPFRSMLLSFVLMAWALGMIVFGFVNRYAVMRRFGLALSLVAISKLFLADLSFLKSGQRILSYFVFGIVFIAISYVYQLFSRRLLPDPVAVPDGPAGEAEADAGRGVEEPPDREP